MLYLFVITLIFITFTIPFFIGSAKFGFNNYTILVSTTFLQLFLRNFFMYFDLPNQDYVNRVLLLGNSLESFFPTAIIFLILTIIFVLSFIFFTNILNAPTLDNFRVIKYEPRDNLILISTSCVALISLYILSKFIGNFGLEMISTYRGVSNDLNTYSADGIQRTFIQMSSVNFFIALSYSWKSNNFKTYFRIIAIISAFIFVFYAIYTSSRASIIVFFISYFALSSLSNQKVSYRIYFSVFGVMSIIFLAMTYLRLTFRNKIEFTDFFQSIKDVFLYIIVNNGGLDIPKLKFLMDYVIVNADFRYGAFLLNTILLYIPRTLWPSKPVNIDTEFGFAVYGTYSYGSGGVPPTVFGEFFWDFAWIGLILASILSAYLIVMGDKILLKYKNVIFIKVIFVSGFLWMGWGVLGSGFSSFFNGATLKAATIFIIFYLAFIRFNKNYS